MLIGGLERPDVTPPHSAGVAQIDPSPGKSFPAEPHYQQIRRQPRMSAIPVRKRMDLHQAVMEAHGDLVRCIGIVENPRVGVREQLSHSGWNFIKRNSKIAFAPPELPRPFPNIAEHSPVQLLDKFLGQGIALPSQRPILRASDVFRFGFVQLAAISDVRRDKVQPFLWSERCGMVRFLEQVAHELVPEETWVFLANDLIDLRFEVPGRDFLIFQQHGMLDIFPALSRKRAGPISNHRFQRLIGY
jgi:hypothetical protein